MGGALQGVQIFILAEGLKIEIWYYYQVKGTVWCKVLLILHVYSHPHDSEICDRRSYQKWTTTSFLDTTHFYFYRVKARK